LGLREKTNFLHYEAARYEKKPFAEKSGILNWLIEGALRRKRKGLNVPALHQHQWPG
jgi:phage/plasmid-associated DNA primase